MWNVTLWSFERNVQQIIIMFLKTKVAVATNFSFATQNANTCSDSTIKTLGKGVKYVQS